MNYLDNTQPVTLWHCQNNTTTMIPLALIRRFRHRLYAQVADSAVPRNNAHWYFEPQTESPRPLPGDEIHESDGTVWTILEVNLSPLTGLWQAVCETFAFAEPTETVEHLRQLDESYLSVTATVPVRVGTITTILGSTVSHKLTFYVRDSITVERGDFFRRNDGSLWKIVRVESPLYRERWTSVMTER
jgi:hypothetical protein